MIDTHLHILPGVDDGPDTMEDSIALARVLVQEGVQAAIATPHYNDEYPRYRLAEIQARVCEVQQALDRRGIPLHLFPGHEVQIKPGLVEDIQSGRAATLNGSRYLLLELWPTSWLPETERVIFELRAAGIIPVLAHVERYHAIQRDPQKLASLLAQGVLAQITTGSLVGMQGRTAQRSAETLLKKGLVHCFGSDAHGLRKRPPAVAQGLQAAGKLLSQQRIRQLSELWPRAMVSNEWYQA